MSLDSALALIESVKDTKVLFIGETIIDEYRFVSPLAKPSKENILAVKLLKAEIYEGGVVAAWRHANSFCSAQYGTQPSAIKKIRYVEENYSRKLFETQEFPEDAECKYYFTLNGVVAVTDFGHGGLTKLGIKGLCAHADFLAVACQTNAANAGFNLITKYPRADYIVIDEPEARLAACDRDSPIEDVIARLAEGRCNKFVVTHGRHGAIGFDGKNFIHSPAFTNRVVDTMGSGDAFFAVTAPMAKTGSMQDLLLIGNAAGALKTQILGHREPVTKTALIEYLKTHAH